MFTYRAKLIFQLFKMLISIVKRGQTHKFTTGLHKMFLEQHTIWVCFVKSSLKFRVSFLMLFLHDF